MNRARVIVVIVAVIIVLMVVACGLATNYQITGPFNGPFAP